MYEPNAPTECPDFTAYSICIGSGETLIAEVIAYAYREGYDNTGYPRTSSPEENMANARLMAASPDLLALAYQYASECGECWGEGVVNGAACGQCLDIRAVIAKATAP
jgi:hypothetical protein